MEKGERRVSPFLVPMMMANACGAAISMRYGLQGPCETICTACAASHPRHRLRRPADRLGPLRRRDHRRRRVGRHHHRAGRLRQHDRAVDAPASASPFDADRDGFVIGEGAGVLVLEDCGTGPSNVARPSSARCWARAAPPTPTTSPRRRRAAAGPSPACELALADAGLERRRHPPDQRPRHVDAAERRGRGRGHRQGLRQPGAARHLDQGRHRSRARRRRRARGGGSSCCRSRSD